LAFAVVVAVAGPGLAAACGSDQEATATPADAPRLDPATLEGEAVTVSGEPYDLGALAGKDLVIWFWAPW
jgi:hypothetical protein